MISAPNILKISMSNGLIVKLFDCYRCGNISLFKKLQPAIKINSPTIKQYSHQTILFF